MLDGDAWEAISGILSTIDDSKRPNAAADDDCVGALHILLFGDLANRSPSPACYSKHEPPEFVFSSFTGDFKQTVDGRSLAVALARTLRAY